MLQSNCLREEVASLKDQAVQYAQHVAALQNESAEQARISSTGNARLKALQSKVRLLGPADCITSSHTVASTLEQGFSHVLLWTYSDC